MSNPRFSNEDDDEQQPPKARLRSASISMADLHARRNRRNQRKRSIVAEDGESPFSLLQRPSRETASDRVHQLLDEADTNKTLLNTHPVFTEMQHLVKEGEHKLWKETGRWIKFEEDVEEGGQRWSKPHVATLSLHSLFELRTCLMNGTVILDMKAESTREIYELIIEHLVVTGDLEEEHRDDMLKCLMLPRRHQYEKKHPDHPSVIGRSMSYLKEAAGSGLHLRSGSGMHLKSGSAMPLGGLKASQSKKSISHEGSSADLEGHKSNKARDHLMKKLPASTEACSVMIGEIDWMDAKPLTVFVRLANSFEIDALSEVPVPTRFLFMHLGEGHADEHHEAGRSMATLMTDEVFRDVAYISTKKQDVIDALDEFLEQVTVLPPGEWDPKIRIEPPSQVASQEARLPKGASSSNLMAVAEVSNGQAGSSVPHNLNENGDVPTAEEPPAPVSAHEDPALKRTGRVCGGLIADIRRKLPFYVSDFTDAFYCDGKVTVAQTIATILFMYFASLAPIVTFGGLLAEATHQRMAAMENLVAGALCGITFHLFAGQPLSVIGSTGPVLVFETIIYKLCHSVFHIEYLPFRFWINLWMAAILLVIVVTDGSSLVSYITRFTEESFATLIALIYIVSALQKLWGVFQKESYVVTYVSSQYLLDHNLSVTTMEECACVHNGTLPSPDMDGFMDYVIQHHDWFQKTPLVQAADWCLTNVTAAGDVHYLGIDYTRLPLDYCRAFKGELHGDCYRSQEIFFMSTLLCIGTYIVASMLKHGRDAPFFPTVVRHFLSDFAVVIAIFAMVIVDVCFGVNTPKLTVPHKFEPTWSSGRGWLINPFEIAVYWWLLAAIPAMLACILIFMDQQITTVIVNRKENKLKKGAGYHLDLFVIALQIVVCGLLGIPIYVAATVLSINHVNSLKVWSDTCAPGEVSSFIGVRENRATGVISFVLVGLSVFITPMLSLIPMPVLYGVFLFMGVNALDSQLWQRALLIFMPMKYQPDHMFLRQVPIRRVHLFTLFQVGCLACLWVIKSIKETSILFPVMLVVMVGVRKLMERVFSEDVLEALDDRMPEFYHRKKHDEKIKLEAKAKEKVKLTTSMSHWMLSHMPGHKKKVQPVVSDNCLCMPLASGNVMKIPLAEVIQEEDDEDQGLKFKTPSANGPPRV